MTHVVRTRGREDGGIGTGFSEDLSMGSMAELRLENPAAYKNLVRVDPQLFQEFLMSLVLGLLRRTPGIGIHRS